MTRKPRKSIPQRTGRRRRQPVSVSYLPTTKCEVCGKRLAYQPGKIQKVLNTHYRRAGHI